MFIKDEPIHLSWPSSRALQADNSRKYSVVSTSAAGKQLKEDKIYRVLQKIHLKMVTSNLK